MRDFLRPLGEVAAEMEDRMWALISTRSCLLLCLICPPAIRHCCPPLFPVLTQTHRGNLGWHGGGSLVTAMFTHIMSLCVPISGTSYEKLETLVFGYN